jgi:hypothetical protein
VRAACAHPLPEARYPYPGHRRGPWRGLRRRTRPPVARSTLFHTRLVPRLRSRFGTTFGGWARAADAKSVAALAAGAAVARGAQVYRKCEIYRPQGSRNVRFSVGPAAGSVTR